MKKRAVILFNLGGPDSLQAVQPFLYNLFKDPAIVNLKALFRIPIAKLISVRRAKVAQKIYEQMGGKSPILELTLKQVKALETALRNHYGKDPVQVFLCMRYWYPMSSETIRDVISFDPDEILLLPLYPQFSTTTTGSSLKDWETTAKKGLLNKPTYSVCCYGTQSKWVKVQGELLSEVISNISEPKNYRVLFSAHGLPKKIINRGDPYQWQVEESASSIAKYSNIPNSDWKVCYQSRVGRLEWIGPSVEEELERASKDSVGVIILPIAFVSEHSETLVELDIEYLKLAKELGVRGYYRVPAIGDHPTFIDGLKETVITAFDRKRNVQAMKESARCPEKYRQCPLHEKDGLGAYG